MIAISPAILTAEKKTFLDQLYAYAEFAKQIDIDINISGDDFTGKPTIKPEIIVPKLGGTVRYGIHLMVSHPWPKIEFITSKLQNQTKIIFYIHQEANYEEVLMHLSQLNYPVAITVKAETHLYPIDFYQRFPEVQLMTIATGYQGNAFQERVLHKITQLREKGYQGIISIDGGVNLDTAKMIREYDLDRVSVGSYFAKADDPYSAYRKLNEALNAD